MKHTLTVPRSVRWGWLAYCPLCGKSLVGNAPKRCERCSVAFAYPDQADHQVERSQLELPAPQPWRRRTRALVIAGVLAARAAGRCPVTFDEMRRMAAYLQGKQPEPLRPSHPPGSEKTP